MVYKKVGLIFCLTLWCFSSYTFSGLIDKKLRIISLSASATESLYAINAGSKVVAVDEDSNYPRNVPKTRLEAFTPNLEAILSYEPDLVVLAYDMDNIVKVLRSFGIAVLLQPPPKTFDEALLQIIELGKMSDQVRNAEKLSDRLDVEFLKVVETCNRRNELRLYHEIDQNFYSASSYSFIGDIYKRLGFLNIADIADTNNMGFPKLSVEHILEKNPEIIILSGASKSDITALKLRPGWSQIAAVKTGRVVSLESDLASRWGPRIVDLARTICFAPSVIGD